MERNEVLGLKRQFKSAYVEYRLSADHLDCGTTMADYIRPELALLRMKVNRLAESLREHDPDFPPTWKPI